MVKREDISDAEMIEAVEAWRRKGALIPSTPDISLAEKYPVKVILAKMQQMVDRGQLDYGVSLRTAWVIRDPREATRPFG